MLASKIPVPQSGDLFYPFLDLHSKFNNQLILLNFNDDWLTGIKAGKGTAEVTSKYFGNLVKVNKADPAADALAQRIGGESTVRFCNDIMILGSLTSLMIYMWLKRSLH